MVKICLTLKIGNGKDLKIKKYIIRLTCVASESFFEQNMPEFLKDDNLDINFDFSLFGDEAIDEKEEILFFFIILINMI